MKKSRTAAFGVVYSNPKTRTPEIVIAYAAPRGLERNMFVPPISASGIVTVISLPEVATTQLGVPLTAVFKSATRTALQAALLS